MMDIKGLRLSEFNSGENPNTLDLAQNGRDSKASVRSVMLLAILILATAHLSVKAFFPNPVFWVIGASLVVSIGCAWVIGRKDYFGFLLALFVCAHFNFADNQGGLWSYVLFAVFLICAFLRIRQPVNLKAVSTSASLLLLIFFIHQVLGTILNPYSLISNIQAIIVAISQVLIFYFFASQPATESNLKRLLSVWFITILWVFVIALNQKYHWVVSSSPLMPQVFRYKSLGILSSTPAGSFQNTELFAEYFCIVFVLALVIFSHSRELASLSIKKLYPLVAILISIGSIMMGGARAAVLLAVAAAFYLTILNFIVAPSGRSFRRILLILAVLLLSGLIFMKVGTYFSIENMVKDFQDLVPGKIDSESVISGEGINRSFTGAYKLLSEGSWWLGYGYNIGGNNPKSLGLKASDYHSLYLCLPFFYGWIGATAYVLLLFTTGLRIYISYLKNRRSDHFLVPIALGLSVAWGVFLLDQYKISVTRNPSYFFLTWMWLGLTHAVANSMHHASSKSNAD